MSAGRLGTMVPKGGGDGGGVGVCTRLATVTLPFVTRILIEVEQRELQPRDADRRPGVAVHKPEPEGHFVIGYVDGRCSVSVSTKVGVGSIQVDLAEFALDHTLFVMTSTGVRVIYIVELPV